MSYQKQTVIRCHREPMWRDEIHATIYHRIVRDGITEIAVVEPLQMRVLREDDLSVEQSPTIRLSQEDAQLFMDELWRCGLRPTEGTGSAGALAAVQAHLKDMQRLVFKDRPAK